MQRGTTTDSRAADPFVRRDAAERPLRTDPLFTGSAGWTDATGCRAPSRPAIGLVHPRPALSSLVVTVGHRAWFISAPSSDDHWTLRAHPQASTRPNGHTRREAGPQSHGPARAGGRVAEVAAAGPCPGKPDLAHPRPRRIPCFRPPASKEAPREEHPDRRLAGPRPGGRAAWPGPNNRAVVETGRRPSRSCC